MPSNEDEYIESWMTKLQADSNAGRKCPMYATDDTLQQQAKRQDNRDPLCDMFKLPVPWKKKDEVTSHIKTFDDSICLEREPQEVRQECPRSCACLCKAVGMGQQQVVNVPPYPPASQPSRYPQAEHQNLCSCKQVVVDQKEKRHSAPAALPTQQPRLQERSEQSRLPFQQPCPQPAPTNPILLSPIDHSACTCPRVPLPLIKPEPKLQKPVQCECVERAQQKAPTFFKCMQERRQINIAQLFSKKDEPKSESSFTVAAVTDVELDEADESKKDFRVIQSIADVSDKSKKSKSSGKKSMKSIKSDKTKSKKTRSDYTVSTASTEKTSMKESSCKFTCSSSKHKRNRKLKPTSEESITSSEPKHALIRHPLQKTYSEQKSEKVNKSCSTVNTRLTRKRFTSKGTRKQRSPELYSISSRSRKPAISDVSIPSRTSKSSRSFQDIKRQNTCATYFMDGQAISSSSSEDKTKRRPKYVDIDDIDKVKKKAVVNREERRDFKFFNDENMKQIKEIIEKETQECKQRLKLAYMEGMYPGFRVGHKTCCLPYMYVPKNMSWLYNTCEGAGIYKPDLGWRPGSIRADVASIMAIIKKGKGQPEFSSPPGGGVGMRKVQPVIKKKEEKEEKSEELDGEGFACLEDIDIYKKRAIDDGQELVRVIEQEDQEEKPKDMRPTLHMHKTHGQYFVTLHPAGKSKEALEGGQQGSVMLTFDRKALDSDIDSDSIDSGDTTTVTEDSMEMDFTSALGMYKRRSPIPTQTVQTITHKFK
ncbi:hypothetical protein O3M35_011883 [Rhynocoris fuscipes]|uniref:Uncharacterized protein n=1 Tax=Rhynocoris fuscipes TaxID=488301 RepID=A0AAW1CXT6_9HEMI